MAQVTSQRVRHRWDCPGEVNRYCFEVRQRTRGEIEAAVSEFISRFEQEQLGRGPEHIQAHLVRDLLVVRLQGTLTTAEKQLANSPTVEKGRDLLKQIRSHLIETARPVIKAMILDATGVKVLSLHHDISTVTGEEIMVFTLAEAPEYRQPKQRQGQ